MRKIEREVVELIEAVSCEDPETVQTLTEASKMFDDLVKSGIASRRGNRLASQSSMPDSHIAFNE